MCAGVYILRDGGAVRVPVGATFGPHWPEARVAHRSLWFDDLHGVFWSLQDLLRLSREVSHHTVPHVRSFGHVFTPGRIVVASLGC